MEKYLDDVCHQFGGETLGPQAEMSVFLQDWSRQRKKGGKRREGEERGAAGGKGHDFSKGAASVKGQESRSQQQGNQNGV